MQISRTTILAITVGVLTIVACSVYLFFFFKIKNINNEISLLQNQLDIEIRQDQRLRSVRQLLQELEGEFNEIDSYFVSSDGVVNFLETLESLGDEVQASVDVNAVDVLTPSGAQTPYEELEIRFASRGSWNALVQLISLLETLSFGITFKRVQLERIPDSFLWQANVEFTVLKHVE